MTNDRAPVPENLVLHENDRQITSWNDQRGRLTFRTIFSADSTATECFVTGVAELPEDGCLAVHRHEHPVRPGSNVFIPGSSERGIRNAGTLALRFFYALAADAFTDIEYVFS